MSASGYPPITLELELDGDTETIELQKRKIPTLYGLARQAFRRNVLEIRRADGELLGEDDQLLALEPGEVLTLSV